VAGLLTLINLSYFLNYWLYKDVPDASNRMVELVWYLQLFLTSMVVIFSELVIQAG